MTPREIEAAAYHGEMPQELTDAELVYWFAMSYVYLRAEKEKLSKGQATLLKDDIIVTVRKLTTRISVSEQLKTAYRKANEINLMLEKRLQPMSDIDSLSREDLRDTLTDLKRTVEGWYYT